MRLQRLLWQLWPWRWGRAIQALLQRGVRVHPSAVLLGPADRCELGRRSVIGAGVRLDLGRTGRVVLGERVWLAAGTEVETTTVVRIGAGTTVQRRSSINGSVRIGRGCIFAPNMFVSSGTHPFRHPPHLPIREQERLLAGEPDAHELLDRPVWIQDDCWLGANVVICPGITVGKGSIVGANAVVTRDVVPYSVVAGAPARALGTRLDWRPPAQIHMAKAEDLVYVLSGLPVHESGRPAAIEVTAHEPLMAIVSGSFQRVALGYRTTARMEVEVGGIRHVLESGDGVIEFPVVAAPRGLQGSMLELTIPTSSASGALQVFVIDGVRGGAVLS